jgi:hypothetical protein
LEISCYRAAMLRRLLRIQLRYRLIAGIAAAFALCLATTQAWQSQASASEGYWSDGWPVCTWWGATWFNPPTSGWARTEGPSCVDRAVVRLQWYDGSIWRDTYLQYSAWGVRWIQYGGSPAYALVGTHQVHVAGWGYSQWGGTQEP